MALKIAKLTVSYYFSMNFYLRKVELIINPENIYAEFATSLLKCKYIHSQGKALKQISKKTIVVNPFMLLYLFLALPVTLVV